MARGGAPRLLRVEDESACTQIRQRISGPDARQARDTTSPNGHHDLSPGTHVVKVAAELIVQLTHTHLGLRLLVM
jgi:hypothetical protein